jgi:hypothetical protein
MPADDTPVPSPPTIYSASNTGSVTMILMHNQPAELADLHLQGVSDGQYTARSGVRSCR